MKIEPDYKEHLKKASKDMPPEAVRQMDKVLKSFFEEEGIPYDASHLKAALILGHLIHPNLPPVYGEFVASSILLLYRLIDEQESGLITSFVQPT